MCLENDAWSEVNTTTIRHWRKAGGTCVGSIRLWLQVTKAFVSLPALMSVPTAELALPFLLLLPIAISPPFDLRIDLLA